MEENDLKKAVCKALSLEWLGAGWQRQRDDAGNFVSKYWVHSVWLATVRGLYFGTVTIGVAKYSLEYPPPWKKKDVPTLYKGIVLIDNFKGSFLGADPLRSVELPDFTDSVAESLRQINLMAQIGEVIPDGRSEHFDLNVFLPDFFAHIDVNGGEIEDASMRRLWDNIHETRRIISEAYSDKAMNDFFDRGIWHSLA
jgi:hypothetical protein